MGFLFTFSIAVLAITLYFLKNDMKLIEGLVVIVLRLLDEEKFLSKNLPGYEEYRQKTRYRLFPFVW
jgi:protein-S-isoprenylcysteine O-methyltransferase Ste14